MNKLRTGVIGCGYIKKEGRGKLALMGSHRNPTLECDFQCAETRVRK